MRRGWLAAVALVLFAGLGQAKDDGKGLSDYFPPTEEQGGWRSLLPETGVPGSAEKPRIRTVGGVDWDRLQAAWEHVVASPGGTGLVVIRRGHIVGEWYRGGDRKSDYNIYSSSKSYTSTAFGLILSDFGNGPLPGGKSLSLDTKVCNADWLPESLPLPDPRKSEITVRHLLNMTSGVGPEPVPPKRPYEASLGHVEGSPFATLKGDPGTVFNYSNAGVSHLVLLFNRAQGEDLFPFVKRKILDPIGETQVRWDKIGGDGGLGPHDQGFSGIHTTPREHARYCYLALHKGEWAGKRVVPAAYYDFAWAGTKPKADYGGQWWRVVGVPGAPADLVATRGRNHNNGYVCPSLDLVFVRLGDGEQYPPDFEKQLVTKVLAAVEK